MVQIYLKIKSFDFYYILLNLNYIKSILNFLNLKIDKQVKLPSKIHKFTLIKSPHIDKKSREQFELKKYRGFLQINTKDLDQIFLLINLLKNSNLIGVELEIKLKFYQDSYILYVYNLMFNTLLE
jgi:small subunit ribosomal protein S10